MEVMYGRMEGLALLFVALALITSVKAFETNELKTWFVASWCAGMAAAFHPTTTLFALAILALAWWRFAGRRIGMLAVWACGMAIPLVVSLALVAPYFREAAAQFIYNRHVAVRSTFLDNFTHLFQSLRWSRYYVWALIFVEVVAVIPWLTAGLRARTKPLREADTMLVCVGVFSLAGCLALISSGIYPYYLVHFSIWPMLFLLLLWETSSYPKVSRVARTALILATVVVVIGWIPSALWNVLRCRDAHLYQALADPHSFAERVRANTPPGARIVIPPSLFLFGHSLGTDSPYLIRDTPTTMPANAWLVLFEPDVRGLGGLDAPGLRGRRKVYQGPLYPALPRAGGFLILAPLPAPSLPNQVSPNPIRQ
jgi:hypothetical protein